MDNSHKIRVKIGNAEFEAEGSQEVVKEQYQLFLDVLSKTPRDKEQDFEERSNNEDEERLRNHDDAVNATLLDRTFKQDNAGVISLKVLPQHGKSTSADSILLLLYGYYILRDIDSLIGSQLMKSAKQSGLPIDRIDRVLEKYREFYNRGGARRGTRYSLNNRGIIKAKEILEEMHK